VSSAATEPATCGVACEVPLITTPPASTDVPGASRVRNDAEFENAVGTSSRSTAPTETAAGAHAGELIAFV
jgi:hypothetical protein